MARIYNSVEEIVGRTPLLRLKRTEGAYSLCSHLFAKLECFNPAGSVKDRVARQMLDDAERRGVLCDGSVIIEPTSGNTGIGLAMCAAARGYRLIIVMPDTMSKERIQIMRAYGAEVVLTEGAGGMAAAIRKAEELARTIPHSFVAGQFVNPANPEAHRLTTGPEIYEDTAGCVDVFVAGIGTGGTVTGVGEYLKSKNQNIKVVGVEPSGSPVLSGGVAGAHGLQGIGAGFVPEVLNTEVYDEIICIKEDEAYAAAREFATREGVLVGISSGAALSAAIALAGREDMAGKNIVVLLPDGADKYFSTPLFNL